jgi:hypothetical protein
MKTEDTPECIAWLGCPLVRILTIKLAILGRPSRHGIDSFLSLRAMNTLAPATTCQSSIYEPDESLASVKRGSAKPARYCER